MRNGGGGRWRWAERHDPHARRRRKGTHLLRAMARRRMHPRTRAHEPAHHWHEAPNGWIHPLGVSDERAVEHADDRRPPGGRGDVVGAVHDIDTAERTPFARPRHTCPETQCNACGNGQSSGVLRKRAGAPGQHVGHKRGWFVERTQRVGEFGGEDGDAGVRAEERRDIDAHLQRHGRSTVVVGAAATLAAVAPTDSAPDLDVIAAEIAAEVHRRRASGEFPPDLERRLDAAFRRATRRRAPSARPQRDFWPAPRSAPRSTPIRRPRRSGRAFLWSSRGSSGRWLGTSTSSPAR